MERLTRGATGTKVVVARLRDPERTRRAVDSLEAHGVDGARIAVAAGSHGGAAERRRPRSRDSHLVKHVAVRTMVGAFVGAAVGAGIGLTASALIGNDLPAGTAVVRGIIICGIIGSLVGGVASIDVSPSWELTFEGGRSRTLVAVRSDDRKEIDRAVELLRQQAPERLEVVDARDWAQMA